MEVMFALFIFSVGVLGIFSLQLLATQNNYDAIQRTTAATLASSIVERMRINSQSANSYISTAAPVPNTAIQTTCNASPGCAPAALAAHDLLEWYSLISGATETLEGVNTGGLTAPSACITGAAGSPNYQITIAWRGRSAIANSAISTCGQGTVVAGQPIYGTNNEFRRIFVLNARIE
jgi:type IV pilus assembly protein PilV